MAEWTWEHITSLEHTTEGPAWDGRQLLFSHLYASQTLSYRPDTGAMPRRRELMYP